MIVIGMTRLPLPSGGSDARVPPLNGCYQVPYRYTCYCQKLREPELNPHWCPLVVSRSRGARLAHSCGEVCEKDRGCRWPQGPLKAFKELVARPSSLPRAMPSRALP